MRIVYSHGGMTVELNDHADLERTLFRVDIKVKDAMHTAPKPMEAINHAIHKVEGYAQELREIRDKMQKMEGWNG